MARSLLRPIPLLRLEAGAALAGVLMLYARHGGGWLLFALLILAPDLSMLGYRAGPRIGAMVYNAAHTYVAAAVLGAVGIVLGQSLLVSLALIWAAHCAWDRMVGYGLKYPEGFKVTHLARLAAGKADRRERAGVAGDR